MQGWTGLEDVEHKFRYVEYEIESLICEIEYMKLKQTMCLGTSQM